MILITDRYAPAFQNDKIVLGVSMSRRTLPLEVRKQLQAIATPVLKQKGAVLFRSGQPCRGAFLVNTGQVRLSLGGRSSLYPARSVSSGSVVGLPATFSGEPYSLTAQAKTNCRLLFISRRRLLGFLHESPQAGLQILRVLSEEIFHMRKVVKSGRESNYSPKIA